MRVTHAVALLATGALGGGIAVPVALAHRSGGGSTTTARSSTTTTHKTPKPAVTKIGVDDNFFTKKTLTIKKGDKVNFVWSNQNFNTHNVTLHSGPKGVSKSKYTSIDGARGIHFEQAYTVPGTYHFVCTIHPDMTITVTVKK